MMALCLNDFFSSSSLGLMKVGNDDTRCRQECIPRSRQRGNELDKCWPIGGFGVTPESK
jgi:hypothetical protein